MWWQAAHRKKWKRKSVARNPYRRYEVTEYQKEALKFLQPPEDITVSEWADKYRVLDAKTSAMPEYGGQNTPHTLKASWMSSTIMRQRKSST